MRSRLNLIGFTVYVLLDPETGEARYVGCTRFPKQRRSQHITAAKKGRSSNPDMAVWITGLLSRHKRPELSVVGVFPDSKRALAFERDLITTLSRHFALFNIELAN